MKYVSQHYLSLQGFRTKTPSSIEMSLQTQLFVNMALAMHILNLWECQVSEKDGCVVSANSQPNSFLEH